MVGRYVLVFFTGIKKQLYCESPECKLFCCRWEPYDPTKSYEKYTIADAKLNFSQKAPVPVVPKVPVGYLHKSKHARLQFSSFGENKNIIFQF